MKKIIDGFLDTLLVIGAFACILTIGGGRWLAEGAVDPSLLVPLPAENASYLEDGNPNTPPGGIIPKTGVAAPEGSEAQGKEYLCPTFPLDGEVDWSNIYMLRSRYFEEMKAENDTGKRSLACR